ncbi:MAG: peptidylprolyl isomerase [Verrucomicrobiota bacterium]
MSNSFVRPAVKFALMFASLLCFQSNSHAQYTNGIYAEFNTSMGSFTCRLEYALAPKACANFMGLATGQRYWVDAANGRLRTNQFYNGLIFHRVITNFMNQAGSPNGQGTDGPGYAFEDEFNPSLRHDGFGVLSSANSGPDSNGAQFFITVTNTSWLDNVHTVFGRLYGGSNVVYAINRVPTVGSKPVNDVIIQSVNIRRVGADAMAFDINAQGLPVVTNLNAKIARAGTNISLTFSNRLNVDNRIFTSSDLAVWTHHELGIETATPVTNTIYASSSGARQFYQLAQVLYPNTLFPPRKVLGRVVTIVLTQGGSGTLIINFNGSGGGNYTINGAPGSLINYTWKQEPYNGRLWPISFVGPLDYDMTLLLNFTSATGGMMTGTVYGPPFYYPSDPLAFPVAGTFTISP